MVASLTSTFTVKQFFAKNIFGKRFSGTTFSLFKQRLKLKNISRIICASDRTLTQKHVIESQMLSKSIGVYYVKKGLDDQFWTKKLALIPAPLNQSAVTNLSIYHTNCK